MEEATIGRPEWQEVGCKPSTPRAFRRGPNFHLVAISLVTFTVSVIVHPNRRERRNARGAPGHDRRDPPHHPCHGPQPRHPALVRCRAPSLQHPYGAELTLGLVVCLLIVVTDLRGAISFTTFGILLYYFVATIAAWTQTRENRRYPRFLAIARRHRMSHNPTSGRAQ